MIMKDTINQYLNSTSKQTSPTSKKQKTHLNKLPLYPQEKEYISQSLANVSNDVLYL